MSRRGPLPMVDDAEVAPLRPSATRRRFSLNGAWALQLDPEGVGSAEGWPARPLATALTQEVPGALQLRADLADCWPAARGLRNTYRGRFWLERSFDWWDAPPHGCWLSVGGVFPAGRLWLNGRPVGEVVHNLPSKFDLGPHLGPPGPQRLTLEVHEDEPGVVGGFRFAGLDWSGVARGIELERVPPAAVASLRLGPDGERRSLAVWGLIRWDPAYDPLVAIVRVEHEERGRAWTAPAQPLAPTDDTPGWAELRLTLDLPGAERWQPSAPHLHWASIELRSHGRLVDVVHRRFGLRTIEAVGGALRLNGEPLYLYGQGQEYFSRRLVPETDRAALRERFRSLQSLGFNFQRCHTYAPVAEELEAADETGFLLGSEVPVLSNFAQLDPFDRGLELLRRQVRQTVHHPSLIVHALGNEGVQRTVGNAEETARAIAGVAVIREEAPGHLALSAFGSQGEQPELPNDFETPHLWSHVFNWAYEGLASVPTLRPVERPQRPRVLHEYGKLGLWPDPAEAEVYPKNGYDMAAWYATARRALAEAGLEAEEARIVRAAHGLQAACVRVLLERARRQPDLSGYVLWTGLRLGRRGGGVLADDAVRRGRPVEAAVRAANAPLALLIDRDFAGRVLRGGLSEPLHVHLSNFSAHALEAARLEWWCEAADGTSRAAGWAETPPVGRGEVRLAAELELMVPAERRPEALRLHLRLVAGGRVAAEADWDFVQIPGRPPAVGGPVVTDLDERLHLRWRDHFPEVARWRDLDTLVRGVWSWKQGDPEATLRAVRPAVLLTDHWGEVAQAARAAGWPVLLIPGREPAAWQPEPLERGGYDLNRLFVPFRSGWDEGPLGTLVEDSPWMGGWPHDGWCGLPFAGLIQGAAPWRTEGLRATFAGDVVRPIVRAIPHFRRIGRDEVVERDDQLRRALASNRDPSLLFATEDRVHLAVMEGGPAPVVACTFRLDAPPAGPDFAARLLGRLAAALPATPCAFLKHGS